MGIRYRVETNGDVIDMLPNVELLFDDDTIKRARLAFYTVINATDAEIERRLGAIFNPPEPVSGMMREVGARVIDQREVNESSEKVAEDAYLTMEAARTAKTRAADKKKSPDLDQTTWDEPDYGRSPEFDRKPLEDTAPAARLRTTADNPLAAKEGLLVSVDGLGVEQIRALAWVVQNRTGHDLAKLTPADIRALRP